MLLMAKAQCHCAVCGNDFEIKVKRRNSEEAASFEEWAAKNITVCRDCERKMKKKEDHERALENSDGLPTLEGTEKQIAWAFDIRGKFTDFSFLDDRSKGFFIEHYLKGKTSAKWWIDHQGPSNARDMLYHLKAGAWGDEERDEMMKAAVAYDRLKGENK